MATARKKGLGRIGRESRRIARAAVRLPGLLTIGNPKTEKGVAFGYLTAVLHLAPHTMAGGESLCRFATPGCIATCLNTAGRGGIFVLGEDTNAIQACRVRRTLWYRRDRSGFLARLAHEIGLHIKRAVKLGLKPAVRLNGTSDLEWESIYPDVFALYPEVQFYDYAKDPRRAWAALAGGPNWPVNYDLTLSRTETNGAACLEYLRAGGKVAAVTRERFLINAESDLSAILGHDALEPSEFFRTVDGDRHDLRFLEKPGTVSLLYAKGRARKDRTGFVLDLGGEW